MVLYSVFKSLDIKVNVRPILEWKETYGISNPNLGIGKPSDLDEDGYYYPRPKGAIIGNNMHRLTTSDMGGDELGVPLDDVRIPAFYLCTEDVGPVS